MKVFVFLVIVSLLRITAGGRCFDKARDGIKCEWASDCCGNICRTSENYSWKVCDSDDKRDAAAQHDAAAQQNSKISSVMNAIESIAEEW